MKELQNFIHKHMDSLKNHKRYVAMLTALSLLVSFAVPLILIEPADSMTKQKLMLLSDSTGSSYPLSFDENISGNDVNMVSNAAVTNGNVVGGVTYSPARMDILTLLFGAANDSNGNLTHQSLYEGCSTIEEALEVDKETYFLGYASDFCAFIEGDFTATEADAEGRVAVGGDLSFTKSWNYQIGSGDYEKAKSLQTIDKYKDYKNEYDNIYGFASALVGGDMYRINTLSTGSKDKNSDSTRHINPGNNTVYYNPNDGLYKSFVISSADTSGFLHYDEPTVKDIAYKIGCKHDYPSDKCTNCTNHNHLENINELSQMYVYPEVRNLIQDTFEYVRSRSDVLSHMQSIPAIVDSTNKKVIFDATGKVSSNAKTVYFSIDDWQEDANWSDAKVYKEIEFKGIPDDANIVVNCAETGPVYISGSSKKRNEEIEKNGIQEWDIKTTLNGTVISIKDMNDSDYKGKNNHPYSSRILYNFYNTNEIHINGSFNGTVLAPNANAESADKGCAGHLSGALIAKSFYGGLEFGYRPYRAGSDILGMTSGYEVPVDKLIAGTSTLLPGAIFEIAEVLLNENGEEILENGERIEQVMSLFESGNSTKYVALPSYIDFSGNTNYITESESVVNNQTKLETLSVTSNTELKSSVEITAYRTRNNDNTFSDPIAEDDLLNLNIGDTIYLVANQNVKWSGGNFNFDQNPALYKQVRINDVLNNVTVTAQLSDNIKDTITLSTEEIKLVVSPKYIVKGDTVNYSLTGVSSNNSLHYIMYYLAENNSEIVLSQGNNNSTIYNYDRIGKVYVKTQFNNYYIDSFEVMYLESPSECTVDDTISFSVPNAPSDATITYTFNGSNVENNTSFVVPDSVGDSIPIVANITWKENDEQISKVIEKTIKVNVGSESNSGNDTAESNNENIENTEKTEGEYASSSVTNSLSILEDENSENNSVFEITSGAADKYITNLTLNFSLLENINNYSFKCTYHSENDSTDITSETVQKSDFNSYTKSFNEDDKITNVEVEILTGAVTITSYDLTCVVPCSYLVKKSFTDITVNEGVETTVFECSESISDFESLTFKLDNNPIPDNRNVGLKFYNKEGDNYTKIADKWDGCSFNSNGELVINNEFLKNNSINISDLRRITIQAKDGATNLHVNEYSLSTFVSDPEYTLPEKEPENITETHKYTIKEAMAPQGYFKTDDYYEVTITETLSTANVVNNTIPMLVDTVIDVKFIDVTTDNAGKIISTNANDYYNSNLTIKYGTDESGNPDSYTRIIEVKNGTEIVETFTIKKDNNGITSVKASDNDSELSYTVTNENENTTVELKNSKATDFTYNNKKYYYNPETMMIIPLPLGNDTEKNLEFSNELGLLFKKVDERGMSVEGATISLTTKGKSITFTDSSKLFELGNFVLGTEYEFSETNKPNGYENAKPIKFKIFEDTNDNNKLKVTWWTVGENNTKINEKTQLIEDTVIEMVDNRILGAKLQLKKIDADTKLNLSGAIFELYASDDTLIKSGIAAGNGTGVDIDLTQDIKEAGAKYIENGYLKPGSYFLKETTIPTHVDTDKWYEDPGKICFTVGDAANNYGITYVPNTSGGNSGGSGSTGSDTTLTVVNQKDQHMADVCMSDGSVINISNVTGIEIVVEVWTAADLRLYFTGTDIGSTDGFESKPTTSNKFYVYKNKDLNIDNLNKFQVHNWGDSKVVVRYVKVTATDGTNEKEYIFDDGTYNPVSTASLDDEIAVVDESGDDQSQTDSATEETPILNVENLQDSTLKILKIANKEDDNKREVKVEKLWDKDSGFEQFRPDVTFTLYQSRTEITDRAQLTEDKIYKITVDDEQVPYTITITEPDANGKWKGNFEDLPTKYREGTEWKDYYYYIVENTVAGYSSTVVYDTSTDGTLTAKNTAEVVDIPVKKHWSDDTTSKPEKIVVQLQVKVENDGSGPIEPIWQDVEGRTLEIVPGNESDWTATFTELPKGYTYRLKEQSVNGWIVDETFTDTITIDSTGNITAGGSGESQDTLEIKNKPKPAATGSLTINKDWDTEGNRPGEVYVKLYRKAIEKYWPEQDPDDVQEDYARLLQYSLYFYDANMCGDTAEEHSALSWRGNCHTDDEVKGGYHDAGDHAMFGLPQGYSASMLGWSYYEFKDAYDNLNQTAHLKAITEHFCDFFVKCISDDGTKILVQKGAGNPDHKYWGAPELQETRMNTVELTDDGRGVTGWTNGKKTLDNEMFWASDSGADIAAEYAAALALAYLNFYDENAPEDEKNKYQGYLSKARDLYDFAKRVENNSVNTMIYGKQAPNGSFNQWGVNLDETLTVKEHPGFYKSGGCGDDIALAAGWLYLATQKQGNANENYKNACSNATPDWAFSWNDVSLAAACVYAHVNSDTSDAWSKVREFLTGGNGIYSNLKSDGYFCRDAWGSARYNAALQMVALVAAKYNTSEAQTYKSFAQTQMAKILGDNTWAKDENGNPTSICLVTGFADNSAKYAHHRAASGWESHAEYKVNSNYDKDSHMLIGAMVGGPSFKAHDEQQMIDNGHTNLTTDVHGDYVDDLHDYCCNEVALDYQAGLVGAAAGLYHFFESGHTYEIPGVEKQYLQPETEAITVDAGPYSSPTITQDNAVSVLADGDAVEYTLKGLVWNLENAPDCNLVKVTLYQYNSTTGQFTEKTLTDIKKSSESWKTWWYQLDIGSLSETTFAGLSIETSGTQGAELTIIVDSWNEENDAAYRKKVTVPATGTATWGEVPPSISIDCDDTDIIVGDSITLVPSGATSYRWVSSDDSIISVNENGIATGNKEGNAIITLYDANNAEVFDSIEITVNEFKITSNDNEITLSEGGVEVEITANAEAEWFFDSKYNEILEITSNTKTNTLKIKAKSYTTDEITLTAKYKEGVTDTVKIKITSGILGFINGEDGKTFEVHVGKSTNVEFNLTNDVIISDLNESIAEISQNQDGTWIITGKEIGSSSFKATRGNTITGIINVLPALSITADSVVLYNGDTLQLSYNNNIGNVTWSIPAEQQSIATVDSNGLVTAHRKGDVTVTATDVDGTTATYNITVNLKAVEPGFDSSGLEEVTEAYPNGQGYITLKSGENWTKTIENLKLTDENGNYYMYYIVELDNNKNPISEGDSIQGNGATFVPTKYENGVMLAQVKTNKVSVTNSLSAMVQGTLPSTGGSGVKTYYYFGGAIMLLGIAGFTGLKRRDRKRREE